MDKSAGPKFVNTPPATPIAPDPADFIRRRLQLVDLPRLVGTRLYVARPDSGLGRYVADHNGGRAPYWAYPWSGGMALACYLQDHPGTVRGRRVLDLGAGGGVVAITAARLGAARVVAAEIDPMGATALALNARASGVAVDIVTEDLLPGPVPDVDLVLAGDLFYAPKLAQRSTGFLERCVLAGVDVLVGDPGRADLPLERLTVRERYDVPEVGSPREAATTPAMVCTFA